MGFLGCFKGDEKALITRGKGVRKQQFFRLFYAKRKASVAIV